MIRTKVHVNLLIVVLLAATFVFVSGRPAHACSCITATETQHFETADAVFRGIATDVPETDPVQTVVFTFSVEEAFKGNPGPSPQITTPGSSASCGVSFTEGARYLVFAREAADGLTVSLCGGTRPAAAGEGPALDPAPPPAPVPPARPPDPIVAEPRLTG